MAKSNTNLNSDAAVENASVEAAKKASKPKKPAKKNKKPLGERIRNFFRVYKSELRKITWTPKEQVRKNSTVVFIVVVISAVLLGVLDLVFSKGITALATLAGFINLF